MRQAFVYHNGLLAGLLTEHSSREYTFRYDDLYRADPQLPAISLTLPKNRAEYRSEHLFPFFSNMLSEGHNRMVQARIHHLDPDDDFGLLLATAQSDVPGAVTIKPAGL